VAESCMFSGHDYGLDGQRRRKHVWSVHQRHCFPADPECGRKLACTNGGYGVVFNLAPHSNHGWKETVLERVTTFRLEEYPRHGHRYEMQRYTSNNLYAAGGCCDCRSVIATLWTGMPAVVRPSGFPL
jgi:hypothetical protein